MRGRVENDQGGVPVASAVLAGAQPGLASLASSRPTTIDACQDRPWQAGWLGTILFAALCLLVLATPLTYWPASPRLNLPLYDSLVALILGPLLVASVVWPRISLPKLSARDWIVLSFLGWIALSAATKGSWIAAAPFVNLGLLLLFLSHATLTQKQTRLIALALVFSGAIVAGHGAYQWLVQGQVPVFSTLLHQNNYSGFLCLTLPLSLCLWTSSRKALNLLGALLTTTLALGMALSLTRAGYLAVLGGMTLFALIKDRRLLIVVLAYAICFGWGIDEVRSKAGTMNALPQFAQRFYRSGNEGYVLQSGGDTINARTFLWRVAMQEFKTAPWTGIGIGVYPTRLVKYFEEHPGTEPVFAPGIREPHSSFVKLLCELGLPGLALFLAFLCTWLLPASWKLLLPPWKQVDPWALALFCGLAAFLVHNLSNTLLILVPCALQFWVALGLLAQLLAPKGAGSKSPELRS
jgi:O-antigen ligase